MDTLNFILMSSAVLLAIVNPVAALATFLSMTSGKSEAERLRIARLSCTVATGVLLFFTISGTFLFKLFGITLAAFQIAGGLVLLLVSLDGLRAKRSAMQETEEEKQAGMEKEDISITPLAIPMLAGPGAITTVMLLRTKASESGSMFALFLLIVLVGLLCYLFFSVAVKKAAVISTIMMNITTRLMGLILAATAVQFILDGVKKALQM